MIRINAGVQARCAIGVDDQDVTCTQNETLKPTDHYPMQRAALGVRVDRPRVAKVDDQWAGGQSLYDGGADRRAERRAAYVDEVTFMRQASCPDCREPGDLGIRKAEILTEEIAREVHPQEPRHAQTA